ncbi:MAG: response regulator, partial [Nitrospirota bacterium]
MSEKILIIDNDPDMVTLLSMLIREKTPYKTEATNNPLEAIEMVKKDWFSVVIAEMKMPVMDGIEI